MKSQFRAAGMVAYMCLTLVSGDFLLDMKNKNRPWVAELDDTTSVITTPTGKKVSVTAEDGFEVTRSCPAGQDVTVTADGKDASCCAAGQRLLGTKDTAFDCCAAGHDLVGSAATGFICCLTGFTYDGKVCQPPPPPPVVCTNGKELVDGKCACPAGQVETAGGDCKTPAVPGACDSGLTAGKCYTFTNENGLRYAKGDHGYTPALASSHSQYGVFQLCVDAACTAGATIDPGDSFRILDRMQAPAGTFVGAQANGNHITTTTTFATAGVFTLTKWPCGKYCWGGEAPKGLWPACPADPGIGGITFTNNPQSCIPITIVEVPCDIHSTQNNCIWRGGDDQCCNPVDCGKAAAAA